MATEAHDFFGGQMPPTEQEIQDYLEGRLSPESARRVEESLAGDSMESDALEGLQQLSPQEAEEATTRIRRGLQSALASKKKRRRRGIADQRWTWIAIVVVLLLVVLCYALMHVSVKK